MRTAATIAYEREDGLGVLVTLNNVDDMLPQAVFDILVATNKSFIDACIGEDYSVTVLDSSVAPDYIDSPKEQEEIDAGFEADVRERLMALRDSIMDYPRFATHSSKAIDKITSDIMDTIDRNGFR